ncbi:sequestosome-1-like [Babylonia areolata]|uniref:sequestosome-1-like n=1 Tax=Babylonia areolata TaxID=304850 RepID=UPI003FCF44E3
MALNVKAFLEKNGDVKGEIRRFQVPSNSKDMFRLLSKKVADVFSLPESGFRLFWQDADGDLVTFSSTLEMLEAVDSSTDGVLRIFVKRVAGEDKAAGGDNGGEKTEEEKAEEEKVHHPGVVCDGCEGSICGPRYKCVICPDYDLCSTCEQKGLHPEHDKFKITHPQTAGGHGGFMPPHFRRWMHRFMKKCPAGYGQCPAGGATAAGESTSSAGESSTGAQSQGPAGSSASRDEFLNDIGANIAAFLDPFGIDVSYEVQHGAGEKKKGHFRTNGQGTGRCGAQGAGPGMFHWDWNMFTNTGGCHMPQGATPGTSRNGDKPAEKPAEKAAEKAAEQAAEQAAENATKQAASQEAEKAEDMEEEVPVTMEAEAATPKPQDIPRSKEASPTGSHDEDWTMLNEGEVTTDGESAAASESAPSAPREGLYPNLKVAQAVEMMKAMGFNDDGGWLTRLLDTTDGDIAQALDTLRLGAQQASRLS